MTYSYLKISKISLPLIIGMLIQVLVGITDTAFLGRVGTIELGASAIGGIIYLVVFMIMQSFASGAQIIAARRHGEERYHKIAHILYQTINVVLVITLIAIGGIYLAAPMVLNQVIDSAPIRDAILIYLLPRSLGFFFSGSKAVLRAFYLAITNTKALLPAALVLLLTNFVFDYWFIFGGLGIAPLGLKGAALASVVSEACACGYLIIFALCRIDLRRYGFNKYLLWSQSLLAEIFNVSIWITIQNLISWGSWLYFFIEIEKHSTIALAISNILRSLSSISFIFSSALSLVTSSIVSNLIGMAKSHEVLPTIKRIIIVGAIPYYLLLIFMALFPKTFLRIYTDDQEIIQQAIAPFYSMMGCYIFALQATIYFFAIYGTGKTKTAFIIEVLSSGIYLCAIWGIVGILQLSLQWCWLTELSYYLSLLPLSYYYIKNNNWCCEKL